jgi:hypothetical protein
MPRSKSYIRFFAGALLAAYPVVGYTQDNAPSQSASTQAASPVKTGKERLGGKASDEQRVDNCNVPPESRGAKVRPDECQHRAKTPLTD